MRNSLECRGIDLTGRTKLDHGCYNESSTVLKFAGLLGDLVMCDNPSTATADGIRAELAARHGITL